MRTEIKYCRTISFILLVLFFITIQHYTFEVYTFMNDDNTSDKKITERTCSEPSFPFSFFSEFLDTEMPDNHEKPTTLSEMSCSLQRLSKHQELKI